MSESSARQRLDTPENIAAFIGKNGGDAAKFLAAFKSFSVATSVTRAKKLMADYKADSVPMLIVNGRWVTSPTIAGSQERALTVVQTHHVCDVGQLPANEIVTPGIFVDRVLHVAAGDPKLTR